MLIRLASASIRGLLIGLLVLMPALMLPGITPDTAEIVSLVALFAAVLTTIEYASTYPSIVEFRDAPPFNRIRFGALFLSILLIAITARTDPQSGAFTEFVRSLGTLIGDLIDFPYSPVRLMVNMLATDASLQDLRLIRASAGISYLISILSLGFFVLVVRYAHWPRSVSGFNVWINLPTFDPTAGSDVVERLHRDARLNILLGLLLPFVIPLAVEAGSALFQPIRLGSAHTLIWLTAAWAFLPASLLMRGIAMGRVADMISERRRRKQETEEAVVST